MRRTRSHAERAPRTQIHRRLPAWAALAMVASAIIALAIPALAGAHTGPRARTSSRSEHRGHATRAHHRRAHGTRAGRGRARHADRGRSRERHAVTRPAAPSGPPHARRGTHAASATNLRRSSRRNPRTRPLTHVRATHTVQSVAAAPAAAPTPPPSGCANTELTPNPGDLEAIREATLCLINRERLANGERALTVNSKLQTSAQGHSESMAIADYFSHEGPGGSTPLSRIRAVGYIYSSNVGYEIGENIAWGTLWLASPKSIVESWMNSPEHRANILDANYRETGIGVDPQAPAADSEGQPGGLYTQDFGVLITA